MMRPETVDKICVLLDCSASIFTLMTGVVVTVAIQIVVGDAFEIIIAISSGMTGDRWNAGGGVQICRAFMAVMALIRRLMDKTFTAASCFGSTCCADPGPVLVDAN
jgi:hypothetical protein